uniref:ATP synthase complex subunit 8 n=1 Tax=Varanus niloticus TaxID=62046 RepID=A1IGT2_VARNI|nr:ATPase subunit 8 [Varanus niloticus]
MPQLNPNPWFLTMVITWLSLIFLLLAKLLLTSPHNLPPLISRTSPTPNWIWSWT